MERVKHLWRRVKGPLLWIGVGMLLIAIWSVGVRVYVIVANVDALTRWAVQADRRIVAIEKIVLPKPAEAPK